MTSLAALATARRVRTPTVLQIEAAECGAASLAMVLAHHGRWVDLDELRKLCGVSRDGSKATNILKAARRFGLVAKGFKKETAQLGELALPAIVFWNFNHFVVLEGVGPRGFRLNDPAGGRRTVDHAEFDESFTGVVLTFAPGPAFARGGRRPTMLGAVAARAKGLGPALAFSLVASAALIVPAMLVPVFTRVFTDEVLVDGAGDWLVPLLWIMVATAAVRAGLTLAERGALGRLSAHLSLAGSAEFMWHVLRLPIEYFTQRHPVEIAGRNALNERLAQMLAGDLAPTALNVLAILLYAAVMVQYDPLLTAVAVTFAAVNMACLAWATRSLTEVGQSMLLDGAKLNATTFSGLAMVDDLKATGTESLFLTRWAGYHAKLSNSEQALGRMQVVLAALPAGLTALSGVAIVVIGGVRVMDGMMSIGMLLGFQALAALFFGPVEGLLRFGTRLQELNADTHRLDDVLRQPLDPSFADEGGDDAPARLSGALTATALTYGYAPLDPPLIDGMELAIQPGQRIALVGGSGSGKSTLGRLMAGVVQPWSGEVALAGRPLGSLPRATLRHSIAYVDQNVTLFTGSVRDNISLWDATLAEERLVRAAQDALIHSDIAARPGGYDHQVREGGRDFSGGQRQRIVLARALALDPSVLVLDEATSALDAETEWRFTENLRRRGCGCVIIAHRLSTIRDCDEIIFLQAGRIVERGRHDALMRGSGVYRALVQG